MADRCPFYFCDSSFWSSSDCCRLLKDKDREYHVGSQWFDQYCRSEYSYKKCPYYNNRNDMASGNSGCFLTSACVGAKGKPDDCYELQTLRSFRDTYMQKTAEGRAAVEAYYEIAPHIVEKIDQQSDRMLIYEAIYSELIRPRIELIESGKRQEAYQLYRTYTSTLQMRFCE